MGVGPGRDETRPGSAWEKGVFSGRRRTPSAIAGDLEMNPDAGVGRMDVGHVLGRINGLGMIPNCHMHVVRGFGSLGQLAPLPAAKTTPTDVSVPALPEIALRVLTSMP